MQRQCFLFGFEKQVGDRHVYSIRGEKGRFVLAKTMWSTGYAQ